jgi:hypothetical protein
MGLSGLWQNSILLKILYLILILERKGFWGFGVLGFCAGTVNKADYN